MSLRILTMPFELDGHKQLRLVAVWDNKLVGVATIMNPGKIASTICQVFVSDEWRGQGIGTALVNQACAEMRSLGSKALSAIVTEHGPMGFWASLGFFPVHCEQDSVLVSKQL